MRTLADRRGELWDAPWATVLVLETDLGSLSAQHKVVFLAAGPTSFYNPGDVATWIELASEAAWGEKPAGGWRRVA